MIKLQFGYYKLVETKAPDGYLLNSDPVEFTLSISEGKTTVQITSGSTIATSSNEDATNKAKVSVKNTPGTELPEAGGPGVYGYQLIGGLTSLSSLAWIFRRKKNRMF